MNYANNTFTVANINEEDTTDIIDLIIEVCHAASKANSSGVSADALRCSELSMDLANTLDIEVDEVNDAIDSWYETQVVEVKFVVDGEESFGKIL